MKTFASDNNAGIHPEVMRAIERANAAGHAVAYGDDPFTARAVAELQRHFGADIAAYFVFNGTAANVLAAQALTHPYNAIVCAESAHLYTDECGAPERFTGCKLLPVSTPDGKIRPDDVRRHVRGIGDQHHVQVNAVSITQATELGTIYSFEDVRELADTAHTLGLRLHMDGARLANAAAALDVPLARITREAGVDALSFGGTKNGMMFGEAVIFFDRALASGFEFTRKQGMQLASKMRFIAAQFTALLERDLWRENAANANRMAQRLAASLQDVPEVRITQSVQANAIFARVPRPCIDVLRARSFFYVWNEDTSEVRWMTSFDTTEEDVDEFVRMIKDAVKSPLSGS